MFFPVELMLNYLVALWVTWHPRMCWEVMGAKDVPSRGTCYNYTIDYHRVIQFFDSLGKDVFSPPTLPYFVLSAVLGVVFAVSFLSALTFTGLEKYLILISKHDLLKRLWAFVHSHLIPPLVCSVDAQQTSLRICSTDLLLYLWIGEWGNT